MKLKRVRLGDVFSIKQGFAFKSSNYVNRSNYRLVTLGNFSNDNSFKFNNDKAKYYKGNFPNDVELKEMDLILPLTEQVEGLLGNSAFVPNVNNKHFNFVLNQRVGKIICNDKKIDKKFLHYLLSTNLIKDQMEAFAHGTRQRNISPEEIYKIEAYIPTISVQSKIGNFLYSIERKIDNNNKICEELESMAKTIYDYWFLQFEFPDKDGKPYKSNGGKMIWNDQLKQEIPEGWEVDNLYRIAKFINGIACQKYRPLDDKHKLPVIKITEMHDGFTENTEFVRDSISKDHIINDGDILFSWSASLGTMIWNNGKGGLNQHIFKVIPQDYFSQHFVYQTLSSYIVNFKRMAEARKTTMGHITKDHLKQSRIMIPPKHVINKFESLVNNFYKEITNLNEENQQLKSLRDFLLPLLVNGQVTVEG